MPKPKQNLLDVHSAISQGLHQAHYQVFLDVGTEDEEVLEPAFNIYVDEQKDQVVFTPFDRSTEDEDADPS